MSEGITEVFTSKRKEHGKGNELKSEHRHQGKIEGEPSGWDAGEFLDDYMQFWLELTRSLV